MKSLIIFLMEKKLSVIHEYFKKFSGTFEQELLSIAIIHQFLITLGLIIIWSHPNHNCRLIYWLISAILENGRDSSHRKTNNEGLRIRRSEREEFFDDILNWRGNIPMDSLRSWGTYHLSRDNWFAKSQRVDGCHEGWDRLNGTMVRLI